MVHILKEVDSCKQISVCNCDLEKTNENKLPKWPPPSHIVFLYLTCEFMGFPCGSAYKESTCNAGDLGLIPGLGRSLGEGKGYLLQYSGLENSMDCMYSPWGRKELDTTGQLSLHFCEFIFALLASSSISIFNPEKVLEILRRTVFELKPWKHTVLYKVCFFHSPTSLYRVCETGLKIRFNNGY